MNTSNNWKLSTIFHPLLDLLAKKATVVLWLVSFNNQRVFSNEVLS